MNNQELCKSARSLPSTPFCFNLKMRPSSQNFIEGFGQASKQSGSLKAVWISFTSDSSWFVTKSPGLKPDWFFVIRLLEMRWLCRFLKIIFSDTLSNVGRREIGQWVEIICLSYFWWTGVTCFFPLIRKNTCFNDIIKNNFKRDTKFWPTEF